MLNFCLPSSDFNEPSHSNDVQKAPKAQFLKISHNLKTINYILVSGSIQLLRGERSTNKTEKASWRSNFTTNTLFVMCPEPYINFFCLQSILPNLLGFFVSIFHFQLESYMSQTSMCRHVSL